MYPCHATTMPPFHTMQQLTQHDNLDPLPAASTASPCFHIVGTPSPLPLSPSTAAGAGAPNGLTAPEGVQQRKQLIVHIAAAQRDKRHHLRSGNREQVNVERRRLQAAEVLKVQANRIELGAMGV